MCHTVSADFHQAGEQRDRARRHDGQGTSAQIVAAFAQTADGAFLGLDQSAVIVAHADAEAALAEIIGDGIGRFEIGELQNAFIDRGKCEPRTLPAFTEPLTETGMTMRWRGVALGGPPINVTSVRGALSTPSHATPMERTGSRPVAPLSPR